MRRRNVVYMWLSELNAECIGCRPSTQSSNSFLRVTQLSDTPHWPSSHVVHKQLDDDQLLSFSFAFTSNAYLLSTIFPINSDTLNNTLFGLQPTATLNSITRLDELFTPSIGVLGATYRNNQQLQADQRYENGTCHHNEQPYSWLAARATRDSGLL